MAGVGKLVHAAVGGRPTLERWRRSRNGDHTSSAGQGRAVRSPFSQTYIVFVPETTAERIVLSLSETTCGVVSTKDLQVA